MTVNHAGVLGTNYFLSYLNLILISRNCTLEEARDLAMELFFHHDPYLYGKDTYEKFQEAFIQLARGTC
jgi:hypothetical protein